MGAQDFMDRHQQALSYEFRIVLCHMEASPSTHVVYVHDPDTDSLPIAVVQH